MPSKAARDHCSGPDELRGFSPSPSLSLHNPAPPSSTNHHTKTFIVADSLGLATWAWLLPKLKSTETHILEQPKLTNINQNHHRNQLMFSFPHHTFLQPLESCLQLHWRRPSSIHQRSDLRSSFGSVGYSPDFSRSPTVTLSLDLHLL
jgi:hypothetical protein